MLYIILLVSLVLFFTLMGIAGVIQTKRLLKTDVDEITRVQTFATTAFGLWIPVIVLFLVVAFSDISFADIGFTMPSFEMNAVVTIIVMCAAAIFSAYFIVYRIIAFSFSAILTMVINFVIAGLTRNPPYIAKAEGIPRRARNDGSFLSPSLV